MHVSKEQDVKMNFSGKPEIISKPSAYTTCINIILKTLIKKGFITNYS